MGQVEQIVKLTKENKLLKEENAELRLLTEVDHVQDDMEAEVEDATQ